MPWTKPYQPPHNQRLEPAIYEQTGWITFITIHAFLHKSRFVNDAMNKMVIETLREEQERQKCFVYAYCLMPDHLHFLVSPMEDGISVLKFSEHFKGKTTNRGWKLGWQGKLLQPRFFDHAIGKDDELFTIAGYILDNPVRKKLVQVRDEWRWSGYMTLLPF